MRLDGVHTALATPFRNNQFDEPAYRKLIENQIAAGVAGIVPVGTTGESPTLTHEEHRNVIQAAVDAAAKRCLVIAGTGSNSTSEAVALTIEAERLGADAALLVAPYYNKPSQEGLYRHFRAVADAVSIPIVLYSIPGRCGIEIGLETVARLAKECRNVVAIKESSGSIERACALRTTLPGEFAVLSGDDYMTLPYLAVGASGVVSVASNVIPNVVVELVRAFQQGDTARATAIHIRHYAFFKDLFIEPNPVPVKHILSLLGICDPAVRLPLCEPSPANAAHIAASFAAIHP